MKPVHGAVGVDFDVGFALEGLVLAEDFDELAVAGATFVTMTR